MKDMEPEPEQQVEAPVQLTAETVSAADLQVCRIPSITAHAFCESADAAESIGAAAADRRMVRAVVSIYEGGVPAAVQFYRETPTPDLIIIETSVNPPELLEQLDKLAEVCDISTRILVIGKSNDIRFYRDLLERGVSEYLLAPVDTFSLIATISRIYGDESGETLGKVYAFIGSKGGVGSSTVAHNVAWSIGQQFGSRVLLVDMDLAFGTASLNFDREPARGLGDVIRNPERVDDVVFDRLLTNCNDHLSMLAAPASLEKTYDLDEEVFDKILDIARANFPYVILDVPHVWTRWSKKVLFMADELVITATPDLPSLTDAKHLVEILCNLRSMDVPPKIVLNQLGVPKRPEIKPAKFAEALDLQPTITLSSDVRLFGQAENAGEVIVSSAPKSKAAAAFAELALSLTGRKHLIKRKSGLLRGMFGKSKPAAVDEKKNPRAGKERKKG